MSLDKIPKSHHDLIEDKKRAFAHLATIMKDGSPQVTTIWFNTDGKYILINSLKGRVKDINMRKRPRVALIIPDPQDPYRYIQIRGHVAEITKEGAREHIDVLAGKYTGTAHYRGFQQGDVRVTYKILPESITVQ